MMRGFSAILKTKYRNEQAKVVQDFELNNTMLIQGSKAINIQKNDDFDFSKFRLRHKVNRFCKWC